MRFCILVSAFSVLMSSVATAQWEEDVRLTLNSSYSYTSYNNARCVATGPEGVVHVVWYDGRSGQCEIYHKRSTDNGATWTADQRITNTPGNSDYPSVAVQDSFVHVVWMENDGGEWEVYYVRSTDHGATWGEETPLTSAPENQWFPCVAASGDCVGVVWDDGRHGGNGEVYYRRSTDGGTTWDDEVRLTNESNASVYPSVSAVDSFVHVVWEDTRTAFDIWYKRSTDFGASWSPDIQLTADPGASYFPASWTAGSDVYVVFGDDRAGNAEVYFKHSPDNGLTWLEDTRLTDASGRSDYPSVSAIGDNVHVVWEDQRDGGSPEVYYKSSADKGLTWKADTRLTSDTARSLLPSVAVGESAVHVVWEDTRDGNLEIYYKRNRSANSALAEATSPSVCAPGAGATVVRGLLWLTPTSSRLSACGLAQAGKPQAASLLDISGRKVLELGAGANDVRHLSPGVYFVREAQAQAQAQVQTVRKVIVTR